MKCASATAGIASVVTGLAVVLSSAPAHSTFLYLNQSQLISAAISATAAAAPTGESPELVGYTSEDVLPVAEEATSESDVEPANVAVVYTGTQASTNIYASNASHDYSAPAGFRWMTPRSSVRADGALPRYRADSNLTRPAGGGMPAATSPSKDSPALGGSNSVTTPAPSVPAATPPAATPPATTPPSATVPPQSDPISLPPAVEGPIVGVPSTSVPEPSTVGLLGIGLLLVFVAIGRGKRARYYSKVSGSPRSSRELGTLARSLNQGNFHKA